MMAVFDPHAERPWSADEDKQLRNAVLQEKEQSRPVKWDTVAASLPRRSKKECRKRWHHTMMEAVRKCQWRPEEDERLLGAVQKSGENWTSIAQVVMTRNDNECMKRWNELQSRNTNASPHSSPASQWPFEEVNIHAHHTSSSAGSNFSSSSASSSSSSADSSSPEFHHDSPAYSSPYGSLSDPMVDQFLRDVSHMMPPNPHYSYDSMDIDPSRLHGSPIAIDRQQPGMHQEHLDAFIDFDAERSGRAFEAQHTMSAKSQQHFDSGDWSWFDNMVAAPSSYSQQQQQQYHHHNHHHHHHTGLPDACQNEVSHDSPGALDSSASSYSSSRSGSIAPLKHETPHPENVDFYNLQNANFLLSKGSPGGVRVVIVCKSNDSRTLSSLDTIMRTLKANGHSVIQESQPAGAVPAQNDDYLCGSLAIDGRYAE